jgi:methionyl-tRNA formyltransferase
MNVHASLLPKYRGAAPINWAILNGDNETGVTVQKMALALDAGDIISQEGMSINDGENAAQLRERMAHAGAALLLRVVERLQEGQVSFTPQDEALASYAPKLKKEMGAIDWSRPVRVINDQVRGLQPWPGAYTSYRDKMLKVTQARITDEDSGRYAHGELIKITKDGFYVACLDKLLLITEIQPEAGKVMAAYSFASGHKTVPGVIFGSGK